MKITSKDVLAGFPIVSIRDLFKKRNEINLNIVMTKLNLDKTEASKLIKELERLNYLQENQNHSEEETIYSLTMKGKALGMAKLIPSMDRTQADKLFDEFMDRVKEVNNNSYYLYKVAKVLLFGSYITQAKILNDIDIVLVLEQKETNSDKFSKLREKRIEESGKNFKSTLDELSWPQTEVKLFLKSRSKYLNFHPIQDSVLDQTEVKQVYP